MLFLEELFNSEDDLRMVFDKLVAMLTRQNMAVNPMWSIDGAEPESIRVKGQCLLVCLFVCLQHCHNPGRFIILEIISDTIIFSEISRFAVRNCRQLKHFKYHILQTSEKFEAHNLLSISQVHKLCSQLYVSDSNWITCTGRYMKVICKIGSHSV